MENPWALRLRTAAECQHGSLGASDGLLVAQRHVPAPGPGLRHKQARRQRRGPQPPPAPIARGRTSPIGPPGRYLPDQDQARSEHSELPTTYSPPRPGRRLGDQYIDVRAGRKHGRCRAYAPGFGTTVRSTASVTIRPGPTVVSRALKAVIVFYRGCSINRSPACRFTPSCSQYALEALERFSARSGLALILRRLVRCRPGGPFGFDPVPDAPALRGRRR